MHLPRRPDKTATTYKTMHLAVYTWQCAVGKWATAARALSKSSEHVHLDKLPTSMG